MPIEPNDKINKIVKIILERMTNDVTKSILFAYCDGVATTYDYFNLESEKPVLQNTDLPRDVMENISFFHDTNNSWTAFALFVSKNGSFTIDYHNDLNPIISSRQALLWLEFTKYNIEPSSSFSRGQLNDAIEAESFKKTLHYACIKKDLDSVKVLLKNVKQSVLDKKVDPYGTPLHIAAQKGELEIVQLLIASGAKLDILYRSSTPFLLACSTGKTEIVKYFFDNYDYYTLMKTKSPLHAVSGSCSKEIIEFVLKYVENINAITSNKYSALHVAVQEENLDASMVLVNNGIDMEILNDYKYSALHFACLRDKPKAAELLLELGANVNSICKDGITPLHTACERGFTGIIKVLIKHSPDYNAKAKLTSYPELKKVSETPIETAKRLGNSEIVDILLNIK